MRKVLVAVLLLASAVAQTRHRDEQRRFGSEQDVERPAKIPKAVEAILQKDEGVVKIQRNEGKSWEYARKWFTASVISLDRRADKLLVVKGEGALLGAHAAPFWIFRLSGGKTTQVFRTFADGIDIAAPYVAFLPDITVLNHTAIRIQTAVYKFDGTKYNLIQSSDEPIQ